MLVFLITESGLFSLDATQSIDFSFTNDVTEYPIESGFSVTKGVVSKSDSFTITGVISDHHLKESFDFRSDLIMQQLKLLKESRQFVTLVSKNYQQDSLIITSVSGSESSSTGHAKTVTIELIQVRTASSASTTVPRSARLLVNDLSDGKTAAGVKAKETAKENTQDQYTILGELITAAGSYNKAVNTELSIGEGE